MNEETETLENIAAILAEMRDLADNRAADAGGERPGIELLRSYADRIEAAAEREREEAKNYFAKLHDGPSMICTAKNCAVRNIGLSLAAAPRKFDEAAPGNAAALREALEGIADDCRVLDRKDMWEEEGECYYDALRDIREKVSAAIAAPARNCDRFQTELDAQLAFLNDVWLISVEKNTMMERDKFENWTEMMKTHYGRWLFATAEGGAK